jgi:Na+/H+ antiporter NhaD/arsenite permease-like protein
VDPLSLNWLIPFAVVLGEIFLISTLYPHKWEHTWFKILVLLPPALVVLVGWCWQAHQYHHLPEVALDYFEFCSVMVAFPIVAAAIVIRGSFRATPTVNTMAIGLGTLFSALFGTAGGSLITTKFLTRINAHREDKTHIFVYVIRSVSNIGGMLLPVGAPLFIGYLQGIPFTWFPLHLIVPWALLLVVTLVLFYLKDLRVYNREASLRGEETLHENGEPEKKGVWGLWHLLILIAMTLVVVFTPQDLKEYCVRPLALWTLAALSWISPGSKMLRQQNKFTWDSAKEIVVLFAFIFLTMAPALEILKVRGNELVALMDPELLHAYMFVIFFGLAFVLSAVLDNAPTYLCLLTLAVSLTGAGSILSLVTIFTLVVIAISMGCCMGGYVTYLGNGPNLLIKLIAEQDGVKMPSFIAYTLRHVPGYTVVVLAVCLMWLWFLSL